MREYVVKVLNKTYRVTAYDRYHAGSVAVRMYLHEYPGSHTFTELMSVMSARLVNPEMPGRRASYLSEEVV
jgi:hypothetical protein